MCAPQYHAFLRFNPDCPPGEKKSNNAMCAAMSTSNCVVYLTLLVHPIVLSQWFANGTAVCDTSSNKGFYMLPQIASDGNSGVFVCWRDGRSGADYDIYAQHIASDGRMLWQKNGIPVVKANWNQQFCRIVGDDKGGAFIAWEDDRSATNTFVYAQHIDGLGHSQWQDGGVKAAENPGLFISLAADDHGGLILAWMGPDINNVFVQRLDATGARTWGDSGVQLSTRPGPVNENDIAVIRSSNNGAIVAWSQGNYKQEQVYVQGIDSTGNPLWSANGFPVSDNAYNIEVSLTPDLKGGGIISWNRGDTLLHAQRVNGAGRLLWGDGGIIMGVVVNGGGRRQTDDNGGGAYVGHSRYIQHVDSVGTQLWPGQGGQFTNSPTLFWNSTQARDGTRGIWNFWTYESNSTNSGDIYAQYFDSTGQAHWGPVGRPVCEAASLQDDPVATSANDGTAIVVWDDLRNGFTSVYATKVDTLRVLTSVTKEGLYPSGSPQLLQNYPNPFNPETTIAFSLPNRTIVRLSVYTLLGEKVLDLINGMKDAGTNRVTFNAHHLSSGVYFYRLTTDKYSFTKKMEVLR